MGGHGGLNILPQKKWNVYREDRQFDVKYDEHRDIERRLAEGEERKRERLTDSLVELRRKSQAVRNLPGNDNDRSDDDVSDHHRKSSRRRERRSRVSRRDHHKNGNDNDTKEDTKRERSRLSDKVSERAPSIPEEDTATSRAIELDKKATSRHINLFEEAEKEAKEVAEKHRESLIKSGAYIYNAGNKGPRSVNVYTDDTSVTLVPDFKEVTTPWYMKPRMGESGYTEASERKGGPRYMKSVYAQDTTNMYREEEELHKSYGNKLAMFYNKKQLPKV